MPLLHIKVGLIKQFFKALDKNSDAFKYLQSFFAKISEAKNKRCYFCWPTDKILKCKEFFAILSTTKRAAWNCFAAMVCGFLGNHKAENCVELIAKLMKTYSEMGRRMSLKVHMFEGRLDQFKENMGAYSEEHGERFHQDISNFICCYQGY